MKIVNRDIFLDDRVDARSCSSIIGTINSINKTDHENKILLESHGNIYNPEPIKLWINSGGGEVYSMLGLYDVIKASKTPIYTYIVGLAASAAGHIFLAGHKRFASTNSSFLIHALSHMVHGQIQDISESLEESNRLQDILDNIITSNTIINQDKLNSIRRRKLDWTISAQDMLKYKVIHEIL